MKKLFFGVAVAAIALSASAFTSDPGVMKAQGDIYVWDGSAFILVPSYSPSQCSSDNDLHCAYVVTAAGASVISNGQATITESNGRSFISDSTPKLAPLQVSGSDVPLGVYNP